MREILHYEDYEAVTDSIFTCNNIVLKFTAKLSYRGSNGERKNYYSEFTYNSKRYNDQPVTSIQRTISSFISIGNVRANEDGIRESIMITYQDMYYTLSKFQEMYMILMEAYQYNSNNRLELKKVYDPVRLDLNGKHMEMIPVILNYDSTQLRGVRITLQTCDNFTDITIDQFMGIKYILEHIDIYGYTLSILSYVGRPEYGTNNNSKNNTSPFK